MVGEKNVKQLLHLSRSLLQNVSLNWTHHSTWLMQYSVCSTINPLHLDRIHNYIKAHTKIIWTYLRSTSKGWLIIKLAVNYNPKTFTFYCFLAMCSPFCIYTIVFWFFKSKYRTLYLALLNITLFALAHISNFLQCLGIRFLSFNTVTPQFCVIHKLDKHAFCLHSHLW